MTKKMAWAVALLCAAWLAGCRGARNTPTPAPSPQASPGTADMASPSPAADETGAPMNALLEPESKETPAPQLSPGAGTLPETQLFINYTSAEGGYDVQAPEDWKRAVKGSTVKFTEGYSGLQVELAELDGMFSLQSIQKNQIPTLVKKGRSVNVKRIAEENTNSGITIHVVYESNSEPINSKKIRLINHRYYYHKNGKLAALTMWSPAGSDNENFWRQLSDTFYWR